MRSNRLLRRLKAFSLIVLYLIILDTAVGVVFRYPDDPREPEISFPQRYLEYGRAIEGKLRRMTRRTLEESAPIVAYGWLDQTVEVDGQLPESREPIIVTAYGMSHVGWLARAMDRIDERIAIRRCTAPGAPPNWAYAAFDKDKLRYSTDVALFGVMTDGVAWMSSTSGSGINFEASYPYTFPRFDLREGRLISANPPFVGFQEFIQHLDSDRKWEAYRNWLAENDGYYDSLLFEETFLDCSAFIRMLRRGYAQLVRGRIWKRVYGTDGFREDSQELRVLGAIIEEFARRSRAEGILPVLYIVNNQGRGDSLYRALLPVLVKADIPYLSTHEIAPPDDPQMFLSENSHFVPEKDTELAHAMIKIINRNLKKENSHSSN